MALVSIGIMVILCIFIELKSDSKIWGNGIKGRSAFSNCTSVEISMYCKLFVVRCVEIVSLAGLVACL